jgi:alkanesulfonate monooxygenase SsuD/methylene tetrahydromethanopterin reductase-like flavin-dependent oxidoreductase (luciferase family)
MTTSLLAALIYCSLVILLFGALIYFLKKIKTRNRYYRPFARPYQDTNWPLQFLRGGGDNPKSALIADERFEALLTPAKQRQMHKRQSRPWEARAKKAEREKD